MRVWDVGSHPHLCGGFEATFRWAVV